MNERRQHLTGVALAVASAVGFAGKAVFIRAAYASAPGLDATTLLALRMIFAAPFFLVMAWRSPSKPPLARSDWAKLAALGFLGYYLSSFLDFWSLEYISAGLERVILFTYPAWVMLLQAALTGRRIEGREVFALLLSWSGIGLTFWSDLKWAGPAAGILKGGALVLGASLVYTVYLVKTGSTIQRIGSLRFTAWVALLATVPILVQFGLTRPLSALRQPSGIYLISTGLAVLSTVIPIFCLVQALRRVSAPTVALASSIGPILTIGLGAVFLGEPVTPAQVTGAALVLGGVGLLTFGR